MPTPKFDLTSTLPYKIRVLQSLLSQEVAFEDLGDGGIMIHGHGRWRHWGCRVWKLL